jgi:adenylosuccinate lyase
MLNLTMPGNPRYQPRDLKEFFGYDNLYCPAVEVEVASLKTLGEMGVISPQDIALLTPKVEQELLAITTTEVDVIEREITKHDIRALVRCMQEILPPPLRRWAHVPQTSYDKLDTARALQFLRAHRKVVRPKLQRVIQELAEKAKEYASTVQIGRTHGQHALPITVGFWLATILNRLLFAAVEMDRFAEGLCGKISGAVGAHNAQVGLGMYHAACGMTYEKSILSRLGLQPAPISTQILPPEPLAFYLFSALMAQGALGQLGRDCRHLMRSEIAEIGEPFEKGQVGSSTMAQKRNPLTFENTEGMYLRSKSEFGKVLDTIISEHQRDLVGSSLLRDFPAIVVNLVVQLDTLLREKNKLSFIRRITINEEALERNLKAAGDSVLAEPLYIALQMAGYEGDAHELVSHTLIPRAREWNWTLVQVVEEGIQHNSALAAAWERVPREVKHLLQIPELYIGDAAQKTQDIAGCALAHLG